MFFDRSVYQPSPWGWRAHQCYLDQVLVGGAAGAGKSLYLLMDPIICQALVEEYRVTQSFPPGFPKELEKLCREFPLAKGMSEGHALHMRRELPEHEENISRSLRMFKKLIGEDATFLKEGNQWEFPSGYKFTFGHCRDRKDHRKYLSKQFCAAGGTLVLMADGSFRAIEDVGAGELVATLEGPRRVVATWDTGVKACVEAVVRDRGEIVGRQVHPTTHPVMHAPISGSALASSIRRNGSARLGLGSVGVWQDFESLLDGLPKSPGKRASRVGRDSDFLRSDGAHLKLALLPALIVPVVLSVRALQTRALRAAGDALGALLEKGTATGSPGGCPSSDCSRGVPLPIPSEDDLQQIRRRAYAEARTPSSKPGGQDGVPTRTPENRASYYEHFYTGERRPLTEGVRMGEAELRFAGWHQTYDLTVEGANHYITETGLINVQTHIAYDEAWELEEEQAEEIGGRLRAADPILRMFLRERFGSNPYPGYLKKWFVDPCPEGNKMLRIKVIDPENGEWIHKTRMFMPGKLDDNPDKEFVRTYKFNLLSKPAHMRNRYLYGDWSSAEGGYFSEEWNSAIHAIEPFKIPRDWPKFRSMDWGYRDYGTIGWWAMDWDGNLYCFYEFTFRLMKDVDVARKVIEIEKAFGFWNKRMGRSRLTGVADTQLWEQRGDSGKSKAQVFSENGVFWQPAEKGLLERHGERISARLTTYDQTRPPALVFFKNCKKCIEAIPGIQVDPLDNTKYHRKSHLKHWVDMVAYAVQRASRGPKSIHMELHEYDAPDRDMDVREESAVGGFGYGN